MSRQSKLLCLGIPQGACAGAVVPEVLWSMMEPGGRLFGIAVTITLQVFGCRQSLCSSGEALTAGLF